jgi:hypothetical protein
MASWRNRAKVADVLTRLPPAVKEALGTQLDTEVGGLVAAIKRAAPVGHALEQTPGELRDSVHSYDGKRELQKRVIADAKDAKGEFIGEHVEFGHRDKGGEHVPAVPFFFPTYRARKAGIKRNMRKAAVAAAKRVAAAWLS